ncbi:hypothetical protein [Shinella sp.]|uniref:hypothetical protein n=1 Tax=Shinella sp. TaxID=1870904 RepID=UPI003F72E780
MVRDRFLLASLVLPLAAGSCGMTQAVDDTIDRAGPAAQAAPIDPPLLKTDRRPLADPVAGPSCAPGRSPVPARRADVSGTFIVAFRPIRCNRAPCPQPARLEGSSPRSIGFVRFSCDTPDAVAATSTQMTGRVAFTGDLWINAEGRSVLRASSARVAPAAR